jgi:hypothetical protein
MRLFQIVLFLVAALSFIAALFFIGSDTGLDLWRAGVAILLIDVVFLMLWPAKSKV